MSKLIQLSPLQGFITGLIAFCLSLYLTPVFRQIALKFEILDKPDGQLKQQKVPTPYLGGLAIYLAFIMSLTVFLEFDRAFLGLLLGASLIVLLGVFDDLIELSPALKLIGQSLSFWVLFRSGVHIELINLPYSVAIGLSFAWLIVVTNAFNIIDVSDGLAAGVALVVTFFLSVIGVLTGDGVLFFMGLSLHGALWGFWRFNKAPARIYLGDSGSLFIGFLIGALTIRAAYTQQQTMGFLVPVFLLFVPLLEVLLVSCARLRKGISPLIGSPDHFAIRLKKRNWSTNQIMVMGMLVSFLGGVGGLLIMYMDWKISLTIVLAEILLFVVLFLYLWNESNK